MSKEKKYPEGIRAFSPRENAPDFVTGSLVITPNDLFTWCKANADLMTEYEGKKQIRLQILNGNKGLYLVVDEYKPKGKDENLPF